MTYFSVLLNSSRWTKKVKNHRQERNDNKHKYFLKHCLASKNR